MDMGSQAGRFAAREWMDPSATRALRATAAFMLPLVLVPLGLLRVNDAVMASFAGHAVLCLDVKGAYALRLLLLGGLSVVFTGSTWLGAMVAPDVRLAVLATGLIALGAGAWRHGLGEYGPPAASTSALLFFLGLGSAGPADPPLRLAAATLAGCVGGIAVLAASWPFLAQHPLRRPVALCWTALSALAEALPPVEGGDPVQRQVKIQAAEHGLREALDQAKQVLEGARGGSARPMVKELEALRRTAAELAVRLVALHPTLDRLLEPPGPGPLAAGFSAFLGSLVNLGRSVGLATVSHQSGHLSRFEVRLMRLERLTQVLRKRAAARLGGTPEGAHLDRVLGDILDLLPETRTRLRSAMERAQERGPISFELFDLKAWALRPLASALNFSLQVDPALVRYTFRLAALMMPMTFAWQHWNLPHGFWMPLCVMVVIQPDYGATRMRATQRAVGTLAGCATGSLLLWLRLPLPLLLAATALTCWAFTFFLKRDYKTAVFFITLLVVLQFQAAGPVTLTLTLQRIGLTMAGCLMALVGALAFWPMWERDRFPPLLAEALRTHAFFADLLCRGLAGTPDIAPATVLKVKRRCQRANSLVFSSLNRMAGDPEVKQEGIERAAALANHTQRLARALSVAAVHFAPGVPPIPGLEATARAISGALEALAAAVEGDPSRLEDARTAVAVLDLPRPADPHAAWAAAQIALAVNELDAMLVAGV
ncbi:FUSC family protein [Mesoterricola sediminis]|uniref:Integral membrane bound transporter domain-containing protein n=1 Tax=Mesoterricola sediminis TaxID=2927980 RepID=A0AA48GX92_9BACT|nr:FUSC family protein [Mesoterricola sediminis]BDU76065.1 hypothetical protein METESE_10230 [Mesoterricola sediminis]